MCRPDRVLLCYPVISFTQGYRAGDKASSGAAFCGGSVEHLLGVLPPPFLVTSVPKQQHDVKE